MFCRKSAAMILFCVACMVEKHHRRMIYTEEKAKVVAAVWGTECIQFLAMLAIFHQDYLKNRMNSSFSSYHPGAIQPFFHIILVQFVLFFISSWYNSSFSSYHPGAIHHFLHIILVQFILFFISSWCNSSFSSYHPGAIHPFFISFCMVQNN